VESGKAYRPATAVVCGLTENAGRETNGRNCRHEIAEDENAGHENVKRVKARHARQTLLL